MERIIGRYAGQEPGPLLIIIGGIHGNEPAGVMALELMFKMLEVEPITNPDFYFKGRMLGIRGNLSALKAGERYIEKDLNRQWKEENVRQIMQTPAESLRAEAREVREIIELIKEEIVNHPPQRAFLLDLHTTTAFGGIFTIVTDDPESLRVGIAIQAPVVQGLLEDIPGTTLHFFNQKNLGVPATAVCFESGQHDERMSVNRAIAAITSFMRATGCVRPEDIETRHDHILEQYSEGLPKVSRLIMSHPVTPADGFVMKPGYKNFQLVKKGEIVARDKTGAIALPEDGRILMPLYQKQGDDGFFLIKDTGI